VSLKIVKLSERQSSFSLKKKIGDRQDADQMTPPSILPWRSTFLTILTPNSLPNCKESTPQEPKVIRAERTHGPGSNKLQPGVQNSPPVAFCPLTHISPAHMAYILCCTQKHILCTEKPPHGTLNPSPTVICLQTAEAILPGTPTLCPEAPTAVGSSWRHYWESRSSHMMLPFSVPCEWIE
jgi:hypothetical protein